MPIAQHNLRIQKWVAGISVLLLVVKLIAYYMTHSVAILTDALESIVNVSAGFIGLYSLYVSAKPRDFDHPYGHGKAEFLSAAVEGTLILTAGALIIYKAVSNLINPQEVEKLDSGMVLILVTALINFGIGFYCFKQGRKSRSLALEASGKHLMSDSYSTFGLIIGLLLLYFTQMAWIDSAVAALFGIILLFTGYRILRDSIAGIMDEADHQLLRKLVVLLNQKKRASWIDLHNLRIIKYGSVLHLDCHLTLPWYLNVHEAHQEVEALSHLVQEAFGESIELFVHTDGCLPFSCRICKKQECSQRKHNFERQIDWTMDNILANKKHQL